MWLIINEKKAIANYNLTKYILVLLVCVCIYIYAYLILSFSL